MVLLDLIHWRMSVRCPSSPLWSRQRAKLKRRFYLKTGFVGCYCCLWHRWKMHDAISFLITVYSLVENEKFFFLRCRCCWWCTSVTRTSYWLSLQKRKRKFFFLLGCLLPNFIVIRITINEGKEGANKLVKEKKRKAM